MSTPALSRSAPIAIAPKPSRFEPQRQGSLTSAIDFFPGSMSGLESSGPASPQNGVSPCSCEACRRRGLNSPGGSDNRRRRPHQSSLSSTTGSVSLIEEMANFGGPTLLKRTLGLQDDRYSQYIGPTTDFEPSLINLSPFDPHDESLLARGTLRKVSDHDTFLLLPDQSTPGYDHLVQDLDEIEDIVRPFGRKLMDLYFDIVHPALPIVQKAVFYEKYDRSYREFSPPMLAAIYILAINWWDHSDELAQHPRPNVRRLEELIRSTLADAMFRPKLSTIQAGLLLSQRPEGDQWAPTAQLVAIAQELGLHLDCTHWKIPPWEKGLRKRLAWALYMQDKWGALVHGRPSHIFASNWGVQHLSPNDFPDVEWDENDQEQKQDVERGRSVFTQMVQLSQILADILDTFYSLRAAEHVTSAGSQGTHAILSMAKPIQLKLKEWYSALPTSIRMDTSFSSVSVAPNSRLSPIGFLHLAYFATEITLHRRIIRSLEEAADTLDPYIQHICRSAAKARLISAMDFVNRLTPSHLRAFWFFASKTHFALIGTFGSLLWATSPGREEAEWYRRRLGEYRWTLSVSSKQGEGKGLTNFAMAMLDISTGLLKKLPEKPSMSRSGSVVDLEATRRQSLLSMGVLGTSASHTSLNMQALPIPEGSFGDDLSGLASPRSPSGDSSDDGMYDNFAPTAGMASLGD
ncbi:hypothetical protein MKZ38_001435 [Zalerion maritima]|uniref:Xylanolytic transcriptional activator regulatory domain-containing protein n=1 Tax=Zalerion maritima TaxID=339359 RepID=A0AAD5RZJ8_9PEZI|nr:hypothetical protein MKZ38_001435 [Zalerion maritima]